ncbi:MAG: helix-turn-helix transcriptional regulator [Armatimonadetes bacterium]|nr:helix-turn-helix transcriptional regulator [Armatimonadota bacterium]
MELNVKEINYCKEIGAKIKRIRQEAGLTQEELSDLTNVHYSYIGKIERGDVVPSLKLLITIANNLNVNLIYFFQIEKNSQLKKLILDLTSLSENLSNEDLKFLIDVSKFLLKKSRKNNISSPQK